MRRAALILLLAGFQSVAWPQAPSALPTPGTTYKYLYKDSAFRGRQVTVDISVSGVDGMVVREALRVAGDTQAAQIHTAITANEVRIAERTLSDGIVLFEFSPYLLATDNPERGHWLTIPGMATEPLFWQVGGRSIGWETITVPAGTFRALRVRLDGVRGRNVYRDPSLTAYDGREFESVVWYAEETKRMIKMQRRMVSRSKVVVANETLELLRHEPR
jgi:hypothetical protein